MTHFVSPDWGSLWPAMRQEAHYGDRVVACFAERPASLHQMLEEALRRNPDGDALVGGDERLTYRQLMAQSERVAAGFAARGVKAGDRVALLLGNRIEFVLALFAATRLGAITVPISVREQTPGLAYMLDHCAAVLLVHEADLAPVLPPASVLPALRSRMATGGACNGSEPFEALRGHGHGESPEPAAVAEKTPRSSSTPRAPPAGPRARGSRTWASSIRRCTTSSRWLWAPRTARLPRCR